MPPRSPESGFQLKNREIFDVFMILLEFLYFGAFCVYKVYNKGYNHLQSLSGILAANHLAGLITT